MLPGRPPRCTRCAPSRPTQLDLIVEAAVGEDGLPRPLHVHLSEQPAENQACLAAYGVHPDAAAGRSRGARLGDDRRARHPSDRRATSRCSASRGPRCASARRPSGTSPTASARPGRWPTRAARWRSAPTSTCSSTCSPRAARLEMNERLQSGQRGRFTVGELVDALAPAGHAALGWPEAGRIEAGPPATWSPPASTRCAPPARCRRRRRWSPRPGTSTRWSSPGAPWCSGGRHVLLGGRRRAAGPAAGWRDAVAGAWGEA